MDNDTTQTSLEGFILCWFLAGKMQPSTYVADFDITLNTLMMVMSFQCLGRIARLGVSPFMSFRSNTVCALPGWEEIS
jgi:hypothetical protein